MSERLPPFLPPDPKGEFRYEVTLYLLNLMVAVGRLRDLEIEKALRPGGQSLTRYRTLAVISRVPDCTMSALATVSTMDRTALTRTIDQLERDGLVERNSGPADRRKVHIRLSPAGEAVLKETTGLADAVNHQSLEGIPEETRRIMVRGLIQMIRNLGPHAEEMRKVLGVGPFVSDVD
jgi:DNA-binding MarR family transcriptional regulator